MFNIYSDIYAKEWMREAFLVLGSCVGFEGIEPCQFVEVECKEDRSCA